MDVLATLGSLATIEAAVAVIEPATEAVDVLAAGYAGACGSSTAIPLHVSNSLVVGAKALLKAGSASIMGSVTPAYPGEPAAVSRDRLSRQSLDTTWRFAMSSIIPQRVVAAVTASPPSHAVGTARIQAARAALDTSVCFCSSTKRSGDVYMYPSLGEHPPSIGKLCSHCSQRYTQWLRQLVAGMSVLPHLPSVTPDGTVSSGGGTNATAYAPACTFKLDIRVSAGGRIDDPGDLGQLARGGDPSAAFAFMRTLSIFIAHTCPHVTPQAPRDPPALVNILASLSCLRHHKSWASVSAAATAGDRHAASTVKFVSRLASGVQFRQTYSTAFYMVMAYGRLVASGGCGHPVAVLNIAIASLVCADTIRNASLGSLQGNPLMALIVCLDMSTQAKAFPGLYLVPGPGSGAVFDRRLLTTYAKDFLPLSSVVATKTTAPVSSIMATSATSMFMDATTAGGFRNDPDRALHPICAMTAVGVIGAHFGCEVVPWCSGKVPIRFPVPSKPHAPPPPPVEVGVCLLAEEEEEPVTPPPPVEAGGVCLLFEEEDD